MQENPALGAALAAWKEGLPPNAIETDAVLLDCYARTTQPAGTHPDAVVYPVSVLEVQEIVRVAGRYGISLYPISRGRNWGYGDACAPREHAVIVDLSRMNHIVEVNRELGYAVIEPGVTQGQLYAYLQQHAPEYWMDCTGAGPEASIIGNVLERGFGHTSYGDHVRTTCGMEVVLPDGELLRTGFGHYEGARTAFVYPYGVGPMLDGLFSQSNLGIVTRIGLRLLRAPEAFSFFLIKADQDTALEPLMDRLRELRLRGILTSAVHVANDLRLLTSLQRYPWTEADGCTPLPEALRGSLRQRWGLGAWHVSGSLTGTRHQVRGARRALQRACAGVGRCVFVNDARLALAGHLARVFSWTAWGARLERQLEALRPNYGLLKGVPTPAPLDALFWRVRDADPSGDPLESGCGLIWISPVIPATGKDTRTALEIVTHSVESAGFEAAATFTFINARACVGIFNIYFDKGVEEERAAAERCYHETMRALIDAGYPPYREAVMGMPLLWRKDDVFWRTAEIIKTALDPKRLIAPGRYVR